MGLLKTHNKDCIINYWSIIIDYRNLGWLWFDSSKLSNHSKHFQTFSPFHSVWINWNWKVWNNQTRETANLKAIIFTNYLTTHTIYYAFVVAATFFWKEYINLCEAYHLKIWEVASQKVSKSESIVLRRLFERSGMFETVFSQQNPWLQWVIPYYFLRAIIMGN